MRATWGSQTNGLFQTYPFAPMLNWPPSPLMASFMFPLISGLYRRYFGRFRHWVMGTQPTQRPPVRRIVWDFNEGNGGPGHIRVGINAAEEEGPEAQRGRRDGQQQRNDNDNADGGEEDANAEEGEGGAQNADPVAAAERTIRVTSGSLGRFVGGALLVPAISNFMGSLLFRLSRYSSVLRRFLAIRPGRVHPPADYFAAWFEKHPFDSGNPVKLMGDGMRLVLHAVFGGTKVFADSDPVW